MAKPHKFHARTTILIKRPSQTPTSTSCHVKATEPCAYFYVWDFSLVGIVQRFMRTMCGSRTGGWLLPCVMSDWQRCVDWLLAKYCRCRLQLDWCWCRWRTSAKGRRRWGLQVCRRQVGLVWGTRWPAESSAGRMVAKIVGRSRGRFLGWASKPRSSRDYVGAESWVGIGGGYTEFAGFAVVHQKTTRLLGWATKLRLMTRRGGAATQAGITTQGGGLTALVAAAEKLRSGGHTSGSQGLHPC
jgi:hypothetical protein